MIFTKLPIPKERVSRDAVRGFTLVELVVVLVTVSMLIVFASPAMSSARTPGNAIICQNNLRQMAAGWVLYSAENQDKLCRNGDTGVLATDPTSPRYMPGGEYANWVLGSVAIESQSTDARFIKNGLLFRYVGNLKCYKCPADRRSSKYPSPGGTPTLRSVSMNYWLNPISTWMASWPTVFRTQPDISKPAMTFVFIDESPGSINDGSFACDPSQATWVDVPAVSHNGGTGIAFADGHCEARKWTDPALQIVPAPYVLPKDPTRADLLWLQSRSTY